MTGLLDHIDNCFGKCCKGCLRNKEKNVTYKNDIRNVKEIDCNCPPVPPISTLISWILLFSFILIFGLTVNLDASTSSDDGKTKSSSLSSIASLSILFIIAMVFGFIVSKIVPPLLGMLIGGFLLKNAFRQYFFISNSHSSVIRVIALSVILARAGLGLDGNALKRLSGVTFRLAFLPCIFEAVTAGLMMYWLFNFSFAWSFLTGFVLGAVSPAVVVPSMLDLQLRRLGTEIGIPSMVIAASSMDDVVAISAHGAILSYIFSSNASIVWKVLSAPIEVISGVVVGIIMGMFLWIIPGRIGKDKKSSSGNGWLASSLVLFWCLAVTFGSKFIHFSGAGALAVLCTTFVASQRWRRDGWNEKTSIVSKMLAYMWFCLQPFLFGLIGYETDLTQISGYDAKYGVVVILSALVVRLIISLLATFRSGCNWKERLFISIAWTPKATVQAVIGPLALIEAKNFVFKNQLEMNGNSMLNSTTSFNQSLQTFHNGTTLNYDPIKCGEIVLAIAVLSICITAPLGLAGISLTSSKLLKSENLVVEMDELVTNEQTTNKLLDEETNGKE
ncbi:hypothetical protein SNEBB_008678 [Seison nebaliae]|nr:hypothetical protein SNEBB_008678 [Seison nebaliae]